MNCQEFWNGEPVALDHLKECRSCAARFDRHQRLAVGLNLLGAQMRRVEAPARVERALVSAYRADSALGGAPQPAAWLAVGTWAAALAATAVLAAFLVNGYQPARTHRVTGNPTQLAVVDSSADLAGMADPDSVGMFLPMPNAEDFAPNETMNLVRVEVPRSAMIALGFAVSEERAGETVEADVMLGADGVARAVRFLDF